MKNLKLNRILLISMVILLVVGPVLAMPEIIIDQNPTQNNNRSLKNVHPSANSSESAEAECFQVTQKWILTQASFQLTRANTPVGNLSARIYATTGTYPESTPNGNILANSTTVQSIEAITTGALFYNFSFSNYLLTPAQTYAIVIFAVNATKLSSENWVYVYYSGDSYSGRASMYASSTWTLFGAGTIDMVFILYGDSYPILTAGSVSALPAIAGGLCTFNSYWTDSEPLSGYIFESNETGTPTNCSWALLSGTAAWANQLKTMSVTGDIIAYKWCVNGTANLWTTTSYYYVTLLPSPTAPSNSAPGAAMILGVFTILVLFIGVVILLRKRR